MNYKTSMINCTIIYEAYIHYFCRPERNSAYLYFLFSISEEDYEDI